MEPEEIMDEINQITSPSRSKVLSTTTNIIKTPQRLKVKIFKDISESESENLPHATAVNIETAKKLAEVSSQNPKVTHEHVSPEPEIKNRKKRSTTDNKIVVPVKRRSSSRSTKGKHYKDQADDALATTGQSSLVNVTQRKPKPPWVNTESSSSTVSLTPKPKKIDWSDILKHTESSVKNSVPTVPPPIALQKPPAGTPGTARKRVGGEGRTASLQRILLELPNLCDPNVFSDMLMKAYGSRLEASKVFECLTTNDLKDAVTKRFSPTELMALIKRSGTSANRTLLSTTSTEAILQEIQCREELRNSDVLLDMILQNLSKKAPDNANFRAVLKVASADTIVKEVHSRSDLKSSENLFNVLLQNLPPKISQETKKSVVKVLIEKFDTSELVDISHEAIKTSVNKIQKN